MRPVAALKLTFAVKIVGGQRSVVNHKRITRTDAKACKRECVFGDTFTNCSSANKRV